MTDANIWAVVPVKPFETAKLRLAGVLALSERIQLARVMVEDVLDALSASRHLLAGVLVVTADAQCAALAKQRGLHVLLELMPKGINHALALAARQLAPGDSDSGMIVVPADLPHITMDVMKKLTRLLAVRRAVALVPAVDDGGTNLLACRPAEIILPSFGPDSFERHRKAAQAVGIAPTVLAWPEMGRDIDRPGDLEAFLSLHTTTRTHDYLARRGLAESLEPGPQPVGAQAGKYTQ
jgi:2-phospho-L-lactate guanylyltransferase